MATQKTGNQSPDITSPGTKNHQLMYLLIKIKAIPTTYLLYSKSETRLKCYIKGNIIVVKFTKKEWSF